MTEIAEVPTEDFLTSLGLKVERFKDVGRYGEKTPDFKISSTDGLFFYCEVKSLTSEKFNEPLKTTTANNRLTNNIHQATKQFKAVNSLHLVPNVLVWKALDPRYNIDKLIYLLKGQMTIEGKTLADLEKYRKRIRKDLTSIDLHIWLYPWGEPDYLLTPSQSKFLNTLQKALKIDITEHEPISC